MESKTKGTMILRCGGRFYKVLKIRSSGDNYYTFECKDLDTRENKALQFNMSGLLEAADQAFKVMKSPKDIFLLDLDRDGKWKIISKADVDKVKR